jgi:folate-dependent tRNA-U54 methylase TrmFO/GidA
MWRRLITLQPKQSFSPVNANFGILPALVDPPRDKKLKRNMLCARSIQAMSSAFSEALDAEPELQESERNSPAPAETTL